MFVYLSKLLPLFVYPLGLVFILLILALISNRRAGWRKSAIGAALILLWLGGNRWVSMGLARSLEWRYLPPEEPPAAEAIVLLGGGTLSAEYPRPTVEVNGAGDRVIYTAWLYRQGSAPYVLLSGGTIDWLSGKDTPAEDMAHLLEMMGVPAEKMWLEFKSRNTQENALYSKAILDEKGVRRILLVTSALHMPRAVGLFEQQGLEVIPMPTDYIVTQAGWERLSQANAGVQLINLVPSVDDLALTTRALKEYLGLLVYRLRGWL